MKCLVLIAGLGDFEVAGKRLFVSCRRLPKEMFESKLISTSDLLDIALKNGIQNSQGLFHKNSRGFGFWQWKSLLISHFSQFDYSHIIYLDAGCDIFPSEFRKFISYLINQDSIEMIVSRTNHDIISYTKKDVVDFFSDQIVWQTELKSLRMIQGGFILVRSNSNYLRIFESMVGFLRRGEKWLFDDSNNYGCEQFIDHRHDQSIMSLLLLQLKSLNGLKVLNTALSPHLHSEDTFLPIGLIAARNKDPFPKFWIYSNFDSSQSNGMIFRFFFKGLKAIFHIFPFEITIKIFLILESILILLSPKKVKKVDVEGFFMNWPHT